MFCNVIYQGRARLRQFSLALHRGEGMLKTVESVYEIKRGRAPF